MQPTLPFVQPGSCEFYEDRFPLSPTQGATAMAKACTKYRAMNTPPAPTRWDFIRFWFAIIKPQAEFDLHQLEAEKTELEFDLVQANNAVNAAQSALTALQIELIGLETAVVDAEKDLETFVCNAESEVDRWFAIFIAFASNTVPAGQQGAWQTEAQEIAKKYRDAFTGYISRRRNRFARAGGITKEQMTEAFEAKSGDSEGSQGYAAEKAKVDAAKAAVKAKEKEIEDAKTDLETAKANRDQVLTDLQAKCDELVARAQQFADDIDEIVRQAGATKH